jgi:hypothetical protein
MTQPAQDVGFRLTIESPQSKNLICSAQQGSTVILDCFDEKERVGTLYVRTMKGADYVVFTFPWYTHTIKFFVEDGDCVRSVGSASKPFSKHYVLKIQDFEKNKISFNASLPPKSVVYQN